jgi:hypothetical protein
MFHEQDGWKNTMIITGKIRNKTIRRLWESQNDFNIIFNIFKEAYMKKENLYQKAMKNIDKECDKYLKWETKKITSKGLKIQWISWFYLEFDENLEINCDMINKDLLKLT